MVVSCGFVFKQHDYLGLVIFLDRKDISEDVSEDVLIAVNILYHLPSISK